MATAYDTWKTNEPNEDAREAWIAARVSELVAEWRTDSAKVREALADALSNDYDDTFAGLLSRVFCAVEDIEPVNPRGDACMADAAHSAWRDLTPYVVAHLKDQAEGAAATEFDRNVAIAADMRAERRAAA